MSFIELEKKLWTLIESPFQKKKTKAEILWNVEFIDETQRMAWEHAKQKIENMIWSTSSNAYIVDQLHISTMRILQTGTHKL